MLDLQDIEGFEWDEGNRDKNEKKHGVTMFECEQVFAHNALVFPDVLHSNVEQRYFALGETRGGRSLFVSFTIRSAFIRVISARDMSKKERRIYVKKDV